MGFFDRIFGGKGTDDGVPRPDNVTCEGGPNVVCAPAGGTAMAMADIPDPVFASGAMGPAMGIKPAEGVVYAPVTGEVTVTTGTLHALGLMSDDGTEILIHVGVDTVNMKGEGFHGFVQKGDRVRAGEPIISMDLAKIAEAGYEDVVITVVTNADDLPPVECVDAGPIVAGAPLMTLAAE